MTGFAVVSTTVASESEAQALARMLVEARLAACVQTMAIDSAYRWNGAVGDGRERLLLCKIRAADFAAVEAAIRAAHSYDVPEIVMMPITAGSASYLAWISESTTRPAR